MSLLSILFTSWTISVSAATIDDLKTFLTENKFSKHEIKVITDHFQSDPFNWQAHGLEVLNWLSEIGVADPHTVTKNLPKLLGRPVHSLQANVADLNDLGYVNIAQIIDKYPPVITLSVENNVKVKLKWLASLGVVSPVKVTESYPRLLGSSLEKLTKQAEWLASLGVQNFPQLLDRAPDILTTNREIIEATLTWLENLGIKNPIELMETNPTFFGNDIEQNLEPKVRWLTNNGAKNVPKIIARYPQILSSDVSTLEAKATWLRSIGVSDLSKVLDRHLSIFGSSLEDKLKPNYEWLLEIGVNPAPIIATNADILGMSQETLKARRSWLIAHGIDPAAAMRRLPSLLSYSIEDNLQLKVDWLNGLGISDVSRTFKNSPTLLGLSLEKNLRPTWTHLHETWAMQVHQIESASSLLGMSLVRIKKLSEYLLKNGVDPKLLTWRERRALLQSYSAQDFIDAAENKPELADKKKIFIRGLMNAVSCERKLVTET